MAGANLPAKKYKKTAPTQLRLSFEFTGNTTRFIDIAYALSIINRKFYRQGVYYYVNSVEFFNDGEAYCDLHTLPDNWVTKNAWNRGFRMFQQMNGMVDQTTAMGRPKYHDFKIYMSELHQQTGSTVPSLHGINAISQTLGADDWDYSQYVSADDDQDGVANADEFYAHMIGNHQGSANNWISIGLIKSYADTRHQPQVETPVVNDGGTLVTDPLANLFDFSSEEQMNDIIENLADANDETPYNADFYVGEAANNMQHVARLVTTTSIGRVAKAPGFCAPFGLICVDPDQLTGAEDKYRIVINLAPGTYHGVYAERA